MKDKISLGGGKLLQKNFKFCSQITDEVSPNYEEREKKTVMYEYQNGLRRFCLQDFISTIVVGPHNNTFIKKLCKNL